MTKIELRDILHKFFDKIEYIRYIQMRLPKIEDSPYFNRDLDIDFHTYLSREERKIIEKLNIIFTKIQASDRYKNGCDMLRKLYQNWANDCTIITKIANIRFYFKICLTSKITTVILYSYLKQHN